MHIADIHTIHSAQWMDINDTGTHSTQYSHSTQLTQRETRPNCTYARVQCNDEGGCPKRLAAVFP